MTAAASARADPLRCARLRQVLTGVARGLTWRTLLIAHLLGLLWYCLPMIWTRSVVDLPSTWNSAIAIISEITVVFMLLAILFAREAVRGGAWSGVAYPVALVIAAACTSVTQWHVRGWVGAYTRVNRPGVDPVVQRTQMIYLAVDVIIHGGLVMLVYVNRRRDLELMQATRGAELARAQTEQRLIQVRLATTLAEVDPAELFAGLAEIQRLFDSDSPRAESALDEFVLGLRARLGASTAANGTAEAGAVQTGAAA